MQAGRRQFIVGLLATGFAPKPTWADAGAPAFLSAAARPDGTYVLCGIDADLNITFQRPLPARGHAAAAHPRKPEAVAFARRPGTFACVIDCTTGAQTAVLNAPAGRHFYGHGAFSAGGDLLYTTENEYDFGRGRIGVWDVAAGYARVDEWDSGGVGPHDIKRLPNSEILVVANGGIDTHPDSGRTKLNVPTMTPNLSYIADGAIVDSARLPPGMHMNSIRHLAVSRDGHVAFGMQWQGGDVPSSLVGSHRLNGTMTLMQASPNDMRDMQGYVGSIAITDDAQTIAVTSPRGGKVQYFDAHTALISNTQTIPDVCGIVAVDDGFVLSSGSGALSSSISARPERSRIAQMHWDNHLIPV